ncbi:MAG TPA: beta-ketoacyl-ACP synthase [Myxococcales bacterium]|nr:beta-ketoacyl-ACP synthase [Myxococcales bacterium]
MNPRRVVITGVGVASPIGNELNAVSAALREGRHGIAAMPGWSAHGNLATRLAAPVKDLDFASYNRKTTRTMGRVALLSVHASDQAVRDAGLTNDELSSGSVGLAYGSTHGSSSELEEFCRTLFRNESLKGLPSTSYLKFMSHTCAANLALHYGITGRIITTCAACVSSSQAIGYGYEAVKYGFQDAMICGGAEELHFTHAGVFDILYATSSGYNDRPEMSPRPFDKARDGLVIGEGAGTLVLESYERAFKRDARIYGEVIGFGTNCDGRHMTNPSAEGMAGAIRLCLKDAGISPDDIDYVNAHGTATELGDIAESAATAQVLGARVPFSSTKGYTGHTLGACGALEAAFCLAMMRDGFLAPGRNLEAVDPRCAPLNYLQGAPRAAKPRTLMTNNFAFGGMNTSLLLRTV